MTGVVLLGPRQIGKHLAQTMADERDEATISLTLRRRPTAALLADPRPWLETQFGKLVVIDEVQRAPDLFSTLRGVIDERPRTGDGSGHFLLLGSVSWFYGTRAQNRLPDVSPMGPIDADEAPPAGLDDLNQLLDARRFSR